MKNIRNIIALILALVCLCSMVACGDDDNKGDGKPEISIAGAKKIIDASNPAKIVTAAKYTITPELVLEGSSTVVFTRGSQLRTRYSYSYEMLAPLGSAEPKVVVEGTRESQGENVSQDGAYYAYVATVVLPTGFALPAGAAVTAQGTGLKVVATVAPSALGIPDGQAIGNVTLTIITSATVVTSMSVTYQASQGTVEAVSVYSY